MPNRLKGSGHMKCIPWFSRLGTECGSKNPTQEKSTVTKPPDIMNRDHAGGAVAPVKKKKKETVLILCALVCLQRYGSGGWKISCS
jgi:hypothetical protein